MFQHPTVPARAPDPIHRRLRDDPWSLTLGERLAARDAARDAQRRWLDGLRALVEPPAPEADFPAFLLETPAFADLRSAIAGATRRGQLDTATADRLQRFVDVYRGYLREDGPAPEAC